VIDIFNRYVSGRRIFGWDAACRASLKLRGSTLSRSRDDSGQWPDASVGDRRSSGVQERLKSAATELRRLTTDQLLQDLKRLADPDEIVNASGNGAGSVHGLKHWSAEYLRIAAELEAAADCCRLVERELRQLIAALIAGPAGRPETSEGGGDDSPVRRIRRQGLAAWLKMIPQRGHSPGQPPAGKSVAASPRAAGRLLTAGSSLSPLPGRADADVTALMLGPLELDVGGRRVVRWHSLKARAVFQYLLIHHDRPVRRDVLMNLQWPGHTHTSARNNLNVALHSLRNTLDGPWHGLQPVLYQDGCYVLNPELKWWMDRDEFLSALSKAQLARASGQPHQAIRHYQRTVELYRGPLFEDDISDDWYLTERRHLDELYMAALESVAWMYFDLGDFASAEYFGQVALTSDPCCESVHRLLMRCYSSEHKQHLVTRQYRHCVDALRDELGVSPSAETRRLFFNLTSASH